MSASSSEAKSRARHPPTALPLRTRWIATIARSPLARSDQCRTRSWSSNAGWEKTPVTGTGGNLPQTTSASERHERPEHREARPALVGRRLQLGEPGLVAAAQLRAAVGIQRVVEIAWPVVHASMIGRRPRWLECHAAPADRSSPRRRSTARSVAASSPNSVCWSAMPSRSAKTARARSSVGSSSPRRMSSRRVASMYGRTCARPPAAAPAGAWPRAPARTGRPACPRPPARGPRVRRRGRRGSRYPVRGG